MAEQDGKGCPGCAALQEQLEALTARLAALEAKLAETLAQLAQTQAQLAAAKKNSSNSSKPPAGDITKPKPKGKKGNKKRKRGGQPGHPRHQRPLLDEQDLDRIWEWRYPACPCCSGPLQDADREPLRLQQIEIEERPVIIEEHRRIAQWCKKCHKFHVPELPAKLAEAGLIGPRLTALVGWLKGVCHMSVSSIKKYFRDVIHIPISKGMICKLVAKVSASLKDPYDELLRLLAGEDRLNVDETGHKDSGRRWWTWCFRATLYSVFKISPSRGSDVLLEVLGREFDGLLGCDYFSAYRKYMKLNGKVGVQFCLAHLIRDYKFLAEHPDPRNREYGKRLLTHFKKLFGIIHRREEYASPATFQRALETARDDVIFEAAMEAPDTREAGNLAERFFLHTESYFRFLTDPDIDPTNNLAEQAIRYVAIHRRLTQGTRGENGQRWFERIATVITTCGQQGRSVFEFLYSAVEQSFAGEPAPTLIPHLVEPANSS
jgi:transposase